MHFYRLQDVRLSYSRPRFAHLAKGFCTPV